MAHRFERIDPMKLKFGDTVYMPGFHPTYGYKERGYVFVGTARGPVVKDVDPTTWCRPEVCIYTNHSSYSATDNETAKNALFPGKRQINERGSQDNIQFLNLCQLSVIEPSPDGQILAKQWQPQVTDEFLLVFKRELEHFISFHGELYDRICAFHTLVEADGIVRLRDHMRIYLKRSMATLHLANMGCKPPGKSCSLKNCDVIARASKTFEKHKEWSWTGRGMFNPRKHDDTTVTTKAFTAREYTLRRIKYCTLCKRDDLQSRWSKLAKTPKIPKSPALSPEECWERAEERKRREEYEATNPAASEKCYNCWEESRENLSKTTS